jgi:hypothetical protein
MKKFPLDKSALHQNHQQEDTEQNSTPDSRTKTNELKELDGLYLTKADGIQNTLNINRLEQRLIRTG